MNLVGKFKRQSFVYKDFMFLCYGLFHIPEQFISSVLFNDMPTNEQLVIIM